MSDSESDPTAEKRPGMPSLEPIKKIRLYESIVKQIQSLISTGKLKPGQRLPPERDLAEELGVSRTSIREALRSLEMMGYLESRVGVGGGTFIKEVTLRNALSPFSQALLQNQDFIVELLEVRLFLETEVARLAAIHRSAEQIAEMERAVQQMSEEIARGETGLNGDNRFHHVLADAANNRVLKEFVRMCGDLLEVEREDHLQNWHGASQHALSQHQAILSAVQSGDEESAQKIMRTHIVDISDKIKSNIAKRKADV